MNLVSKMISLFQSVELQDCDLIDLCIVIDSSGSIRDNNPSDGSYDNWELMLVFVQEVIIARDAFIGLKILTC